MRRVVVCVMHPPSAARARIKRLEVPVVVYRKRAFSPRVEPCGDEELFVGPDMRSRSRVERLCEFDVRRTVRAAWKACHATAKSVCAQDVTAGRLGPARFEDSLANG
jgi:hypothetical protein